MTERQFRMTNKLDDKTGRPLRDRETGKIVTFMVEMTPDEITEFEAERSGDDKP